MKKTSDRQSPRKYDPCSLRSAILCLLFLITLFFGSNFVIASAKFVRISLPKGLELEFPKNWIVLSNNERIELNSYVETRLNLSDLPIPDSKLPFAANYYNDVGETIGIANVRYYPNVGLTQEDVSHVTPQDICELDAALKENISKGAKAVGMSVLTWNGTKKIEINGLIAFITEYRRKALKDSGAFRVRLIRVFASGRSFTLTLSYLESAGYLKTTTDRIIQSVRLSGYNISAKSQSDSAAASTEVSTQQIKSEWYSKNSLLTLIISGILTWGIGLSPPLLLRFVILRRPIMSKGWVVGIVALFWLTNIVVFTALGSTNKTHGALLLVALVSYGILRKGAKKQKVAVDFKSDLKLCPSCHALQDGRKNVCPNCGYDLTKVDIYK
ncbi:MAG: hypothetical protein H8E00_01010 [Deltaproteobacteria bacterium]|nr:hypothetical protein [Deltaproteobacteria bacterium]